MSFQLQIDQAIKEQHLYFLGDALPADWYAAFKAWLPLAEGGDVKAAYNVGTCYLRGEGVGRSSASALDWYRRAADAGDTRAMLALYEQLKTRTPAEAEEFLQRATAAGDERAIQTVRARAVEQERRQRQQAEDERNRTTKQRSLEAVRAIEACLARKDVAGARQRAEAALQEGFQWAGQVIAALSLKIDVRRRFEKRYVPGMTVILNGTSHASGTTYIDHFIEGTVSNPTAYSVNADLPNLSPGFGLVPAGGSLKVGSRSMNAIPDNWGATFQIMLSDPSLAKIEYLKIPAGPGQVTMTGGGPLPWKAILLGGLAIVVLLGWLMLQ